MIYLMLGGNVMEASIVDLRYNMKSVLQSLDRNETVKIYYHGKLKGTIYPNREKLAKRKKKKVQDHPIFGVLSDEKNDVEQMMKELRGGRYNAL